MKKQSIKELLLIFLFLCAIVILSYDIFLVVRFFNIQRATVAMSENIKITRAVSHRFGNISSLLIKSRAKKEFVNQLLPNTPDDTKITQMLTILGDHGNIAFINLSRGGDRPSSHTELGQLHTVTYNIELIGEYRDLVSFVRDLYKLARVISVKKVRIEGIDNMLPSLYAKISLETYYIK